MAGYEPCLTSVVFGKDRAALFISKPLVVVPREFSVGGLRLSALGRDPFALLEGAETRAVLP